LFLILKLKTINKLKLENKEEIKEETEGNNKVIVMMTMIAIDMRKMKRILIQVIFETKSLIYFVRLDLLFYIRI